MDAMRLTYLTEYSKPSSKIEIIILTLEKRTLKNRQAQQLTKLYTQNRNGFLAHALTSSLGWRYKEPDIDSALTGSQSIIMRKGTSST
jgi:hypothetical protein